MENVVDTLHYETVLPVLKEVLDLGERRISGIYTSC